MNAGEISRDDLFEQLLAAMRNLVVLNRATAPADLLVSAGSRLIEMGNSLRDLTDAEQREVLSAATFIEEINGIR